MQASSVEHVQKKDVSRWLSTYHIGKIDAGVSWMMWGPRRRQIRRNVVIGGLGRRVFHQREAPASLRWGRRWRQRCAPPWISCRHSVRLLQSRRCVRLPRRRRQGGPGPRNTHRRRQLHRLLAGRRHHRRVDSRLIQVPWPLRRSRRQGGHRRNGVDKWLTRYRATPRVRKSASVRATDRPGRGIHRHSTTGWRWRRQLVHVDIIFQLRMRRLSVLRRERLVISRRRRVRRIFVAVWCRNCNGCLFSSVRPRRSRRLIWILRVGTPSCLRRRFG